ncbi:hypothetical protein [Neobacillus citreus]|uniref:Uncharacterized protein n=2 Tax=Neobacillus TaxID=2675232 RepID=A0A9J6MZ29_9BACI|nr:hypothetical protein [Neobacillus citreus]MCH6268962.1 hypothetical protein [Neobacillus citreus]
MKNIMGQSPSNKQQKGKSLTNGQNSGTQYHEEHAGNIEGYGQPHPITNSIDTKTNNTKA